MGWRPACILGRRLSVRRWRAPNKAEDVGLNGLERCLRWTHVPTEVRLENEGQS